MKKYLLTTKYICSFNYLEISVIFLSIKASSFLEVGEEEPALDDWFPTTDSIKNYSSR
jgi:hypothetical protein